MPRSVCIPVLVLLCCSWLAPAAASEAAVRKPAVAGLWYDGTAAGLRKQVETLLSGTAGKSVVKPGEPPVAIVVPHAGYQFSGRPAAAGFGCLQGGNWDRVLLLGPAHRAWFKGASLPPVAAFETPLGKVPLDLETCRSLSRLPIFVNKPEAHVQEHDLECQLPFLQVVLPKAKIVPILVGELDRDGFDALSRALLPLLDERTILVVSTDFTHYGPVYGYTPFRENVPEQLRKMNLAAADRIIALDFEGFMAHVQQTGDTICGRNPLGVAIQVLKALSKRKKVVGTLVDNTTSGAVSGDWTNSVSYLSILFTDPVDPGEEGKMKAGAEERPFALTPAERQTLLRLARNTLEVRLSEREARSGAAPKAIDFEPELTPTLRQPCGVFVTLTRKGSLRGCIGYVVPVAPLHQAVAEMAVNAALHDGRFTPVSFGELQDIAIEISVLSPMTLCPDQSRIKIGTHGLMIQKGGRSGLLLPQVPVEWNWDRRQFLEQVCRKAGLPANAYLDKDARLMWFTAVVFHEK